MDALGKLVHKYREKKGDTFKTMARKCKISEAFAKHVEYSKIVPISPRVIESVRKTYGIPRASILRAADSRYRRGRMYYRNYARKARKAA